MKNYLLFILSIPLFLGAQTRVLFLGNSYTAVNDLPGMFDSLSTNGAETVVTSSVTPGGFTFQQHVSNAASLAALAQPWDFIVLQEQSQRPSFSPTQVASDVYPYAEQLDSMAALSDSCTRTVFYMTWGRKNGDAMNCPSYPPVCTYAGMQQRLRDSYLQMANDNNAIVAPAGVAWQQSILQNPTLNLYDPDESHPNLEGTYLTACVMYATIFQKDPALLTWDGGLAPAAASFLRGIASQVVLDSMPQWNMDVYSVQADFGVTINNYTIQLSDSSLNATQYQWAFGDGNTDTLSSPSHTYTNPGTYTLTLIASSSCDSDTLTQQIVIADTSVTTGIDWESSVSANILLYPNPGREYLEVVLSPDVAAREIALFDVRGIKLMEIVRNPEELKFRFETPTLPGGIYFIQAGEQRLRWVKE